MSFLCANNLCHARVVLDDAIEAKLRRSGSTFYCPAGHPQSFSSPVDPDKKIADLELSNRRLSEIADEYLSRALAAERKNANLAKRMKKMRPIKTRLI